MQLWLCLRLQDLAFQCLPQRRPQALAVLERGRVCAVNPAASLLGIEIAMDPSSARALAADTPLQLLERDRSAERHALEGLCCWAYGVTPHLYCFRDDSLMLEISGSLKLFGGVAAILRHCQQGLACRGYSAEMALAPSPLGAWALSHTSHAPNTETANGGDDLRALEQSLKERLAPLPLGILSVLHPQFEALQRSGLRYLRDLFALPGAALAKRCGKDFRDLLMHLSGEVSAPLVHFEPPSCFLDSYPLGYPVRHHDELGPALEQLLGSLEDYLRQRQLQTRRLLWQFSGQGGYREHGDYQEQLEVRTSDAGATAKEWYQLTRLRLESTPFKDEVELVRLRVSQLEATQPANGSLFKQAGQQGTPAQLVDLLSNRLGPQAVSSLRCRDAHLPEDSLALVEPQATESTSTAASAQRPFWLFSEPEPLRSHNGELLFWGSRLELFYGPERIEDKWWEKGTSRDYFVARNAQGQRFWVFHERRLQRWYVHGLFA
ncbi:MAG: DNA polymerase Y family protein [Congregibacter sp.]